MHQVCSLLEIDIIRCLLAYLILFSEMIRLHAIDFMLGCHINYETKWRFYNTGDRRTVLIESRLTMKVIDSVNYITVG